MLKRVTLVCVVASSFLGACGGESPPASVNVQQSALGRPTTGKPTIMNAYYDHTLFTINFTQMPPGGEKSVHDHNGSLNVIYQCDACEGQIMGGNFVSVLDAIQGDGFNPHWEEQQITFNTIAPTQFFSDNEILDAAMAGKITITDTDEIYICSVLGPKKK
jgi:hypothetical protein